MTPDAFFEGTLDSGDTIMVPALGWLWWFKETNEWILTVGFGENPKAPKGSLDRVIVTYTRAVGGSYSMPLSAFLACMSQPQKAPKRTHRIPMYVSTWILENGYTWVPQEESMPCCKHCGLRLSFGDHFMMKNEVWAQIAAPDECLHLWCAEELLGRDIKSDDLSEAPLNRGLLLMAGVRDRTPTAEAVQRDYDEHLEQFLVKDEEPVEDVWEGKT